MHTISFQLPALEASYTDLQHGTVCKATPCTHLARHDTQELLSRLLHATDGSSAPTSHKVKSQPSAGPGIARSGLQSAMAGVQPVLQPNSQPGLQPNVRPSFQPPSLFPRNLQPNLQSQSALQSDLPSNLMPDAQHNGRRQLPCNQEPTADLLSKLQPYLPPDLQTQLQHLSQLPNLQLNPQPSRQANLQTNLQQWLANPQVAPPAAVSSQWVPQTSTAVPDSAAVNLVTQPELYNALYAAVTSIIQNIQLPSIRVARPAQTAGVAAESEAESSHKSDNVGKLQRSSSADSAAAARAGHSHRQTAAGSGLDSTAAVSDGQAQMPSAAASPTGAAISMPPVAVKPVQQSGRSTAQHGSSNHSRSVSMHKEASALSNKSAEGCKMAAAATQPVSSKHSRSSSVHREASALPSMAAMDHQTHGVAIQPGSSKHSSASFGQKKTSALFGDADRSEAWQQHIQQAVAALQSQVQTLGLPNQARKPSEGLPDQAQSDASQITGGAELQTSQAAEFEQRTPAGSQEQSTAQRDEHSGKAQQQAQQQREGAAEQHYQQSAQQDCRSSYCASEGESCRGSQQGQEPRGSSTLQERCWAMQSSDQAPGLFRQPCGSQAGDVIDRPSGEPQPMQQQRQAGMR